MARVRQKRKLRMIGLLMLSSQILLLFFISEWIRVQYHEQARVLNNDLQNIFVRTEERLSDSLLDHTVSIILRTPGNKTFQGMEFKVAGNINGESTAIRDSIVRKFELPPIDLKDTTIKYTSDSSTSVQHLIVKSTPERDSLPDDMKKIFRVALLQTANAEGLTKNILSSPLDNKLLLREYLKDLRKKNYSFKVGNDTVTYPPGKFFIYRTNTPAAIPVSVSGQNIYLAKAILPQSAFSLFLLLLTGIAFWLAYRNMRQQARFNEQKDSMISNISHELKTPVATTKVALEALSSFNAIEDPVRTKKYLRVAEWEMERLERMIDRVMNIMQTETGNILLHKEPLNFASLLAEITETLQPIFSEKNITVLHEKFDEALQITADKTHLIGALYNILDNAVKYGGDTIKINLEAKGDQAILKIQDNGPGISPEFHKRIFEHFFRVPSGNLHDVKGHGLGLSYVRHIISAHGGNIKLESSPGNGATFIISLPQNKVI